MTAEEHEFELYTLKNEQNKASLDAWLKKTGIELVQVNGQRKYGGPPTGWVGLPPSSGSEVFIGKIPQDMYEDQLVPLFQSVGQLYEFRLMMTFSGGNRGFAYAKYVNRRVAKAAIAVLNNYEVEKDCFIMVCRSIEKCKLSVDELPLRKNKEVILQLMKELTAGVRDVSLYPSPENKLKATDIVKYETHQAAAVAKKALVEGYLELWGHPVVVDWLKPQRKVRMQKEREKAAAAYNQLLQCPVPCPPDKQSADSDICQTVMWDPVDSLSKICMKRQLGLPVYHLKRWIAGEDGVIFFKFQVFIRGIPCPLSNTVCIKPSSSVCEYQQVKRMAALQVLTYLGSAES